MTRPTPSNSNQPGADGAAFYRDAMRVLTVEGLPFLVGGAYALRVHTGIVRDTKDFDLFVLPADARRALTILQQIADRTDLKYPHWLGKAYRGEHVVDVIFSSGNGLCPIDRAWFEHATSDQVLDFSVSLAPAEEMIWQKAFIMERHRFDGGDVIQLLFHCGRKLDWDRLLDRFGEHWLVLLSHLLLFQFAFPEFQPSAMKAVVRGLLARLEEGLDDRPDGGFAEMPTCRGTFLSLLDYLPLIQSGNYRDARLPPTGRMEQSEIAHWTATFER